MAATPVYALRYPVPTDPADVPADMQNLANDTERALGTLALPAPSATPPANPVTGTLWVHTNGWLFRYDAGQPDAYKWVYQGGPPTVEYSPGVATIGAVNTWTNISSSALSVARAGLYVCEASGRLIAGATATTSFVQFGLIAGLAPIASSLAGQNILQAAERGPFVVPPSLLTLAAGGQLTVLGQANVANAVFDQLGWTVLPSRVA